LESEEKIVAKQTTLASQVFGDDVWKISKPRRKAKRKPTRVKTKRKSLKKRKPKPIVPRLISKPPPMRIALKPTVPIVDIKPQSIKPPKRAGASKFLDTFAKTFTRPIIGHPGWVSSITPEQKARIKIERLKQISQVKGQKIEMATDYEAMIYLSTASLSAPLSRSGQRIYFHLFKKFYPEKSEFIPEYEAKLDIQSKPELLRLKRWLYKKSTQRR